MNCTPEKCPHRALMEKARAACLACDHTEPAGHGGTVSYDSDLISHAADLRYVFASPSDDFQLCFRRCRFSCCLQGVSAQCDYDILQFALSLRLIFAEIIRIYLSDYSRNKMCKKSQIIQKVVICIKIEKGVLKKFNTLLQSKNSIFRAP